LPSFLDTFDTHFAPQLRHRTATFRKALELLEQRPGPHAICETGCMRVEPGEEAARNDGSSTMLWDAYANHHPDTHVYSCELDREAVDMAANYVSNRVTFYCGDSVNRLRLIPRMVDLLYLDSFDLSWQNPHPSALHHLKEMASASPLLKPGALVLIDDCGPDGGKGMYVANWLHCVGATPILRHYQYLWRMP
jgi:hypothetical protein